MFNDPYDRAIYSFLMEMRWCWSQLTNVTIRNVVSIITQSFFKVEMSKRIFLLNRSSLMRTTVWPFASSRFRVVFFTVVGWPQCLSLMRRIYDILKSRRREGESYRIHISTFSSCYRFGDLSLCSLTFPHEPSASAALSTMSSIVEWIVVSRFSVCPFRCDVHLSCAGLTTITES